MSLFFDEGDLLSYHHPNKDILPLTSCVCICVWKIVSPFFKTTTLVLVRYLAIFLFRERFRKPISSLLLKHARTHICTCKIYVSVSTASLFFQFLLFMCSSPGERSTMKVRGHSAFCPHYPFVFQFFAFTEEFLKF